MFCKTKKIDDSAWRSDLNQYEKQFLLPALKERVEGLKEYFDTLVSICDRHRADPTFGAMLIKLTTAPNGARLVTPSLTDVQMSEKYFSEMISMANTNYIGPINQLTSKFTDEVSLEKFADLMNETNRISSSVLQAKDKLFLYDFSTFYSLHDKTSGEVVDVVPRELTVLLMPFKNLLQNMVFLCEGLSGTIHAWHKEQVEWRSKSLEITNNKLNRQNQFLTILVAFALSILFFMSSDPYRLYQLEKINDGLSSTVDILKKELSEMKVAEQGYKSYKATSPKSQPQVPTSKKDEK